MAKEESQQDGSKYTYEKLKEMLDFFEAMSKIYDKTQGVPTQVLKRIARSDRVTDLIKLGKADG